MQTCVFRTLYNIVNANSTFLPILVVPLLTIALIHWLEWEKLTIEVETHEENLSRRNGHAVSRLRGKTCGDRQQILGRSLFFAISSTTRMNLGGLKYSRPHPASLSKT